MQTKKAIVGVMKREINLEECSWLDGTLKKGMAVFLYKDYTFGLLKDTEVAITTEPNDFPFIAIPKDAVVFDG